MRLYVLFLALFCLFNTPILATPQPEISPRTKRLAAQFEKDIRAGRLNVKANHAIQTLLRRGAYEMKLHGHYGVADFMMYEWATRYQYMLTSRDLGDHAPLSQWLAEKYEEMEFILGKDICHALRLDNIKIINFGIPVALFCVDHVDAVEYQKHFQPLAGVVTYWSTFGVCIGATFGTGFLFCTPIAMGTEWIMYNAIAPNLSPQIWTMVCHN